MPDAEVSNSPTVKETSQIQPLEVLFSAALAGFAALTEEEGLRAVYSLLAPPLGHVIVKLGRWIVEYWVPRWTTPKTAEEIAEQASERYIKSLRKRLKNKALPPDERVQTETQIRQLQDAIHQRRLRLLEIVPTPAPTQ